MARITPRLLAPALLPTLAALLLIAAPPVQATIVRFDFSFTFNNEPASALLRLFNTASPRSSENFLAYTAASNPVDRYAGTFIHRVPDNGIGGPGNFVVQGGGFTLDNGVAVGIDLDDPIPDEPGGGVPGVSNTRGTIAFAKSGPDTVTSQWFINLDDNTFLDNPTRPDGGFNAFGRVLGDGLDLFDAIDTLTRFNVPIQGGGSFPDVPVITSPDGSATALLLSGVAVDVFSSVDYDFDGTVDTSDFDVWRADFGSTRLAEADGNGDALISAADYVLLRDSIPQTAAVAAATVVPEPATLASATGLFLLANARRRRR